MPASIVTDNGTGFTSQPVPKWAKDADYADEEVFAQVVHEHRLHSLVTASSDTDVGPSVIKQFLVEVGALQEQDDQPPSRRLFDAQANTALLAEIPTLVGPIAMREAMGATRQELVALEEDDILVPRNLLPKVKNPWRSSDGTAPVNDLQACATPVSQDDLRSEATKAVRSP